MSNQEGSPSAIGEFLREKRLLLGLTVNAIAAKFDVEPRLYELWECGSSLPPLHQSFAFLQLLGSEGRERFGLFLGPLLDEIRGTPDTHRGRAFDALAIILERAPEKERLNWIAKLESAAASYSGLKKRSASVQTQRRKSNRR